jgi:autotransporter-associated beta strand protein
LVTANYTYANTLSGLTLGKVGNLTNVSLDSLVSIAGPITIYAPNITLNQALRSTSGGLTLNGQSNLNGGTIERNAAGQTVANAINIGSSGGTILGRQVVDDYTTFSGQLTGTGTLTVQGLVRLTGVTNTHSGNVVISNASATYLRLSASETLGNNAALSFGGTNATLRIDSGFTETVGSLSGTGNIFVSKVGTPTTGTLKFGGDNTNTSLTAGITNNDGLIDLVKQGTGTFTLSANGGSTMNNFTVSSGTVSLLTNNFSSGAFLLGDADTGTNHVQLTTTGASLSRNINVTANGTGTVTIGSTGGSGNANFSGQITLNRATTFTGGSTDRTSYTGKITGDVGTLTILGGQRTVFESTSGLNDFTGDISIEGSGTVLQIGAATLDGENIPNTASVTLATGTILKLASNANKTETINALNGAGTVRRHEGVGGLQTLVMGANNGTGSFSGKFENGAGSLALVKNGTGTQSVTTTGQNASGGITVNGGTFKLNAPLAGFNSGVFSASPAFTVNSPGILEVAAAWNIASTNTFTLNGGTLHFTHTGSEANANYLNNFTSVNGTISGNAFRTGNNTAVTFQFSGDSGNTISAVMGMVKNGASQSVTMNVANGAAAHDLVISGAITDVINFSGSTLVKTGAGTMVLSGTSTYTGNTLVSAGTLLVTGVLGNTALTVENDATLGGNGTLGGSLSLGSGANLNLIGATIGLSSSNILSVAAGKAITLTDFMFSDIIGWDASAAELGTYTLINGGGTLTLAGTTPTIANPFDFGNGKQGYFQSGSLQVVVIPEPSAFLLGGIGSLLFSLRRRRKS